VKRTVPLRRITTLRRISFRRRGELNRYGPKRKKFLRDHPYCQFWLAENSVSEAHAIAQRGRVRIGKDSAKVSVPRSSTIHHRNKRRGARLLEERFWMAVSWAGHRFIEQQKKWARDRAYLTQF